MCGCEHRTSHAGGVVPPGPWPVAGWAHVVSATLVPGPWSLVPGPWPVAGWAHVVSATLVPGPWSLSPGPWSLVPGPWSLVPGQWQAGLTSSQSR